MDWLRMSKLLIELVTKGHLPKVSTTGKTIPDCKMFMGPRTWGLKDPDNKSWMMITLILFSVCFMIMNERKQAVSVRHSVINTNRRQTEIEQGL